MFTCPCTKPIEQWSLRQPQSSSSMLISSPFQFNAPFTYDFPYFDAKSGVRNTVIRIDVKFLKSKKNLLTWFLQKQGIRTSETSQLNIQRVLITILGYEKYLSLETLQFPLKATHFFQMLKWTTPFSWFKFVLAQYFLIIVWPWWWKGGGGRTNLGKVKCSSGVTYLI
jgi:hypothetical protein